jgi:DNA-binding NarL/FixJ family response regulator
VTRPIRVAVVEEHDIFRRGLLTCLAEDPGLVVSSASEEGVAPQGADVAVVSSAAARRHRFFCPLVVCAVDRDQPRTLAAGNVVAGVLQRSSLTEEQLQATVRAAAAGLRVNAEAYGDPEGQGLDERSLRVVELLAQGRSTREIADDMSYSERTIKKHIQDLERRLRARSRAQVVAHAIRQGLI